LIVIAIIVKGAIMIERRWLSPNDLEKHPDFLIPKQTQAKMRMQGRIPYSKIGNKFIRYDRLELNKWLENNAVVTL
jgi:hypothetical protein